MLSVVSVILQRLSVTAVFKKLLRSLQKFTRSFNVQVAMNPVNTVFDAKRLIGRKFADQSIQSDIKHWPFKVIPGPADKPMIEGEFVPSSRYSRFVRVWFANAELSLWQSTTRARGRPSLLRRSAAWF